jgi:hypothetical protein
MISMLGTRQWPLPVLEFPQQVGGRESGLHLWKWAVAIAGPSAAECADEMFWKWGSQKTMELRRRG